MKTIKWENGNFEQIRGLVTRSVYDKWMYVVYTGPDGKVFADVDSKGNQWDNLDIPFDTVADAKRWCEAHWMTVGFQG